MDVLVVRHKNKSKTRVKILKDFVLLTSEIVFEIQSSLEELGKLLYIRILLSNNIKYIGTIHETRTNSVVTLH